MTAVLLDTHAWAWSLAGDARLSPNAHVAIEQADTVLVSPISFFGIARKVRLGKWPEMVPFLDRLPSLLEEQGGKLASFGPAVCLMAGTMDWSHRGPFDRLLAATALHDKLAYSSGAGHLSQSIRPRWHPFCWQPFAHHRPQWRNAGFLRHHLLLRLPCLRLRRLARVAGLDWNGGRDQIGTGGRKTLESTP